MNNEQISLEQSVQRFPAKHRVYKEYQQLQKQKDDLWNQLVQMSDECCAQKKIIKSQEETISALRNKIKPLKDKIQELKDLTDSV